MGGGGGVKLCVCLNDGLAWCNRDGRSHKPSSCSHHCLLLSSSGAEMDSSPERAKDTTPSSKSEAWTDPWARQGPSGQTREKKRRDISHRGDTPVELAPRKRRSPKGIETPLQQGVQAEEAKGVKEEQAVKEKRKTLEEKKADIKEGKADIKEGKGLRRSPGQDKEGERQSRKRGLSTSPDVASDDSASDAEERKTAPKKRGRKEWYVMVGWR